MSVHVGQVNLTLGVGISTRDSASLVPGRNSDPEDEISLSYMDAHDGLLYSPGGGGGGGGSYCNKYHFFSNSILQDPQ